MVHSIAIAFVIGTQTFCKPLKNHREADLKLLDSVFKALNVYFNYTGTSKCLDVSSSSAPTLGERGWDYQVCINTFSNTIHLDVR